MEIPVTEQYVNLTTHLRYLNDKMIQAFGLFIKLATAIIGSVYYIHFKLDVTDPRRAGVAFGATAVLCMVGVGTIVVIVANLHSWREYRDTLSKQYPDIPGRSRCRWWMPEALMCVLVVATCILFWLRNPL